MGLLDFPFVPLLLVILLPPPLLLLQRQPRAPSLYTATAPSCPAGPSLYAAMLYAATSPRVDGPSAICGDRPLVSGGPFPIWGDRPLVSGGPFPIRGDRPLVSGSPLPYTQRLLPCVRAALLCPSLKFFGACGGLCYFLFFSSMLLYVFCPQCFGIFSVLSVFFISSVRWGFPNLVIVTYF